MGRLSNLSRKDIVQKLERLGFMLSGHGANHDTYWLPGTDRVASLPRHTKIKEGTLQGMLRQAGIPIQDFLNA